MGYGQYTEKGGRRLTIEEQMKGVEYINVQRVGHNRVRYTDMNMNVVYRLYRTDVIRFKDDGTIVLDTGGWNTHTTRRAMNEFLKDLPLRVWGNKPVSNNVVTIYDDSRRIANVEFGGFDLLALT